MANYTVDALGTVPSRGGFQLFEQIQSTRNATQQTAGLMSPADKKKLDGLENYVHPNSGVIPGMYRKVTVDEQGHITAGFYDTPVAEGDKETLANYNIGDAYIDAETGTIHLGEHGITPLVPGDDLAGSKINGGVITPATLTDRQILVYDSSTNTWVTETYYAEHIFSYLELDETGALMPTSKTFQAVNSSCLELDENEALMPRDSDYALINSSYLELDETGALIPKYGGCIAERCTLAERPDVDALFENGSGGTDVDPDVNPDIDPDSLADTEDIDALF